MRRIVSVLLVLMLSAFLSMASGLSFMVVAPLVFALAFIANITGAPVKGALFEISATSDFIGTNRSQFITDLVFGAQTLQRGLLHMIPNKHDKIYLPIVETDADQLQDREEEPSTSATSAYTEKFIDPKDMQWFQKFNPAVFEHVWSSFWPGGRLARQTMSPAVLSAVIGTINRSLNNQLDRLFWQGDESLGAADPMRFFNGFIKLFNEPGSGVINTAFNTGFDVSNILTELEKIVEACPSEVKNLGNPKIITSHSTVELYEAAARSLDFKGSAITDAIAHRFGGFQIVPVGGVPDDYMTMVDASLSPDSNLLAGTWLPNEKDNLIIERFRPESELWFILTKFRMGVQFAKGHEIAVNQQDPTP